MFYIGVGRKQTYFLTHVRIYNLLGKTKTKTKQKSKLTIEGLNQISRVSFQPVAVAAHQSHCSPELAFSRRSVGHKGNETSGVWRDLRVILVHKSKVRSQLLCSTRLQTSLSTTCETLRDTFTGE